MSISELNKLLSQYRRIDYKLVNPNNVHPNDHDYLENRGYKLNFNSDCTYSCNVRGLHPSSYGDWGSIYDEIAPAGRSMIVDMINKEIIRLWRYNYPKSERKSVQLARNVDGLKFMKLDRSERLRIKVRKIFSNRLNQLK